MQITVSIDTLKALQLFAAKGDIRYYLNGIKVEAGNQGIRLIACDGHTMGVTGDATSEAPITEPTDFIIPGALIEQAVKAKTKWKFAIITIADGRYVGTKEARKIVIKVDSCEFVSNEVQGVFPDWQRVLPAKVNGQVAVYDPDYLVRAKKARSILGLKGTPDMGYNGAGAAVFIISDRFMAIVMPMRDGIIYDIPPGLAKLRHSAHIEPQPKAKVAEAEAASA